MTTVETDRNCKSKQKNGKLRNAKCIKIPNFRKLTDFEAFLETFQLQLCEEFLGQWVQAIIRPARASVDGSGWCFPAPFLWGSRLRLVPSKCREEAGQMNQSDMFFIVLFYVNCHSIKDWNDWCAKHPFCAIQSDFQPFCFSHMFTESDFHGFMPQGGSNANAEASSNSSNISWRSKRHWIEPIRSLVWQLLFGILRELANSWLEQMEKPDLSR